VIEKVARQLAVGWPIEGIATRTHEALAETPVWSELQSRLIAARGQAEAFLAELHLPHVPSLEEIRGYAEARLARTASLDDIARRTRQILLESILARLLKKAEAATR
jgi:stearoyl-CoA desaturase (delta-9 desaturase)